ncbi:hypothetical protein BH23VER1_BH23VER1_34970 [soil metagenome]
MKLPPVPEAKEFTADPWIVHLPMFLRALGGVPSADALADSWAPTLDAHQNESGTLLAEYRKALRDGDKQAAFHAGINAIESSFLSVHLTDPQFLKNLETWADDRDLDLPKSDTARWKSLGSEFRKALEKGGETFEATNKRAAL